MSNNNPDKTLRCSFCGTPSEPFLDALDYNSAVSEIVFHYQKCPTCDLVSLVNVPEDLGRYYIPDYHGIPSAVEHMEKRAQHERYKIELVQQFTSGGNLLEIGPSWGAFCLLAKRAGFSVEAIERDPECCKFLNSKIQIKAILSDREAMALEHVSTPDVIALWHVIEHMRDPLALLKRAAECLAPGGILVVATPNPFAMQFSLFGRYWAHLDAPRHINLIPADLLRKQMQGFGLEPLLCTTTDPGSLECNAFGWRKSLSNLVKKPLKNVVYYWGRLAADVAGLVEGREGKGGAYTAIFRKPKVAASGN